MTPMMQQYHAAKEAHPGMLVLFRNGDFYELFEDDAELGHRQLGLTLTRRDKEIPMAGFPQHKLEFYLAQLLRLGHRVAVCEQMEEPGPGKKIIRREVNRIVTPGTVTEEELLDPRRPNHLAAICRASHGVVALAWADLSTGSFWAQDLLETKLLEELARLQVVELLRPERDLGWELFKPTPGRTVLTRPDWTFDPTTAPARLREHFQVRTMNGFGFEDDQPALIAAGGLLQYLQETMKAQLGHMRRLVRYRPQEVLILDETTRRSLELTRTLRDHQREGSLWHAMDRTVTPMGSRWFHEALLAPLHDLPRIEARLDAVEELTRAHGLRQSLRDRLRETNDLQRLSTKVATARATPKDLAAIARTLERLPAIKSLCNGRRAAQLQDLHAQLEINEALNHHLKQSLVDEPPINPKEGGIFREGFHGELDDLRRLARDGRDWIARYQAEEVTRTGIQSLKVGFTDVMGYYIEITNANETRVPPDYIHERTLKNAKRYSTPRLKEYEEKVVTAQERSQALEFEMFLQLRDEVARHTEALLRSAEALAQLDFLSALAELAATRNYVRPVMTAEPRLEILAGRHPVLDQTLPAGAFVPNDLKLDDESGRFHLITGPNMSGKSTFIRQTALLVLLAHMGSFVPAEQAIVGLADRIFTRVGASDELGRGQSTFMVEMTEAANILNHATSQSLVILDEIGRGTSTYDGVSLAWAMTEYLHNEIGCRTLFATHYHELSRLEGSLPRLRNYTVEVDELNDEIIFLHRIRPGSAGKSYGIHVARLAGVPGVVLQRATELLADWEGPRRPTRVPNVRPQVSSALPAIQATLSTGPSVPEVAAVSRVTEPVVTSVPTIEVDTPLPNPTPPVENPAVIVVDPPEAKPTRSRKTQSPAGQAPSLFDS